MIGHPYPEESLQRAFERRLSEHDNVDYIGELTQDEVNKMLGRASLLVNTSPREGFSNVFIQAWMREVPVLTLGVNPDRLLDDGQLGGAFGSASELAAAIRELTRQPERLASMGKHCRDFAMSNFSMSNADALADLIVKSARELPAPGGSFGQS
jgi:glycosyltransferase involved in cell wall biosynthesis